jgi:hypothetical protein
MLINIFMKNIDKTFRKNVESNIFSQKNVYTTLLRKMLVEKCWLNIFVEMLQHFLKNVETFSNARDGGKIKGSHLPVDR